VKTTSAALEHVTDILKEKQIELEEKIAETTQAKTRLQQKTTELTKME